MSSEELISVVMSTYNDEKYLKESIESILNQTYENFEFIIINDGSTDNSLNLIQKYALRDDRIVLISRKNKGFVVSLNDGIRIARGKYIARMDADDISLPERFEKQMKYIKANNIDILATYMDGFGERQGENIEDWYKWYNLDKKEMPVEKAILDRCFIGHPTVIMKSDIAKNLLYNEEFKCAEDYDLWMRAFLCNYRIDILEEYLFKCRIHNDSKTVKDTFSKIQAEVINVKMNFLKHRFNNVSNVTYLVWGAGDLGAEIPEIIDKIFKDWNCVGYIDKYKIGCLNNRKIYKVNEISSLNFDYIVIATQGGKKEAYNLLNSMELEIGRDYLSLVHC